jgi:1-acyl-sn-glycerol-3-phosphate acyltransferase
MIGILLRVVQVYTRVYHHAKFTGRKNIPTSKDPGPLVVVCNHTAGVDPLLVQTACPFEVRWMMATDMRLPRYEWFWQWAGVISIDRTGKDATGAREAIRHVKSGGVLGVFPEGAIEYPARHIMPFHPGVGLIISRTGAPVLPVVIEGTPQGRRGAATWTSLWKSSHSHVTFGPLLSFDGKELGAAEVVQRLHQWYLEATGWPSAATPRGPAFREPEEGAA